MKLIILIFLILFAFCERDYAQCGKNIRLTASRIQHLDEQGKVTKTELEKSLVQIGQSSISVTVKDEVRMICKIKSIECNWTEPFMKGRTSIKAVFSNDNGDIRNIILAIEGTDEGRFILFEMEDNPGDRVKIVVDSFEVE